MQLLRQLGLFVLLITCNIMYSSQELPYATTSTLTKVLYKTYDRYKEDFIDYLPKEISREQYKNILISEQERLTKELESTSYKNVIFSFKNMANIGTVLGVSGLEYQLINKIFNDPENTAKFMFNSFDTIGPKLSIFIAQNAYVGLYALQLFAGFSFIKSIKNVKDKKNKLSEQYDKCTKMLMLLDPSWSFLF